MSFVYNILGMSPPRIEAGLDTIAWNGTADGSFNWKSAYGVVPLVPDPPRP